MTRRGTGDPVFDSRHRHVILLFSIAPRPAEGLTRLLLSGYREFLPPWLRPSRRRISRSPCNAEARNERSINCAPTVVCTFVAWAGTASHFYLFPPLDHTAVQSTPSLTLPDNHCDYWCHGQGPLRFTKKNLVNLYVFLIYTTNPAHLRMHSSLTLTILAEEYKWLNSLRVLLDLCYFLFLELFVCFLLSE
jgi:hypothetical protein